MEGQHLKDPINIWYYTPMAKYQATYARTWHIGASSVHVGPQTTYNEREQSLCSLITLKSSAFVSMWTLSLLWPHGNQGAACLQDTQQRRPKNSLCLLPDLLLGLCPAVTWRQLAVFPPSPASPSIASRRERTDELLHERRPQNKRCEG